MTFKENTAMVCSETSENDSVRPLGSDQNGCQIHPEIERRGEIFENLKQVARKIVSNENGLGVRDLDLLYLFTQSIYQIRFPLLSIINKKNHLH